MSLSNEEKIRVLEKRIRRLEDVIAKGASPQYFFCPSLNCWLPAQCDDEGRLVIDPSDLDTRYHKKSEDLDLDTYNLLTKNLRLEEYMTDYFRITNRAGTVPKGLLASSINCSYANRSQRFRSYAVDANSTIEAGDTSTHQTVATLVSHATDYRLDIPRAGNIDLLSMKILDTYSGIFKLPFSRPATPTVNCTRYLHATDLFEIYDGTDWKPH